MARDTRNQTSYQSTQKTKTKSSQTPNQAAADQPSASEREQQIQTERERGTSQASTSRGLTTQGGTAPIYGGQNTPFSLIRRLSEDMDQLFDRFGFGRSGLGFGSRFSPAFSDDLWSGGSQLQNIWSPQLETFRRGDDIVIRADIPGVKKEDVNVEIDNDVLTISGERREEHEEDREGFYRSERSYGNFYRSIPLPEGVNADQCDANFKDGVLEVTLKAPQQAVNRARKIQIK